MHNSANAEEVFSPAVNRLVEAVRDPRAMAWFRRMIDLWRIALWRFEQDVARYNRQTRGVSARISLDLSEQNIARWKRHRLGNQPPDRSVFFFSGVRITDPPRTEALTLREKYILCSALHDHFRAGRETIFVSPARDHVEIHEDSDEFKNEEHTAAEVRDFRRKKLGRREYRKLLDKISHLEAGDLPVVTEVVEDVMADLRGRLETADEGREAKTKSTKPKPRRNRQKSVLPTPREEEALRYWEDGKRSVTEVANLMTIKRQSASRLINSGRKKKETAIKSVLASQRLPSNQRGEVNIPARD